MIIGIDLGTTNSLAAYFTPEGARLIPNRLGKNLTPSIVSIDEEGQVYIGETARERMRLYPSSAASVFKRSMGSDKEFVLNGKAYRAEELSSFVLRSLKEDAEAFLGEEVTEAVISVPAYFNDATASIRKTVIPVFWCLTWAGARLTCLSWSCLKISLRYGPWPATISSAARILRRRF